MPGSNLTSFYKTACLVTAKREKTARLRLVSGNFISFAPEFDSPAAAVIGRKGIYGLAQGEPRKEREKTGGSCCI
jgi:hypothetical protein